MAEFFNKKEEILEVQLTEYGKYLLSLGKLDPVYYCFYDDEILYNSEYAGTLGEAQNDIDRRIRYETPNLKVIPTRTSAETRVTRFIESVEGALGADNSDPANNTEALHQESFSERSNFSSYPIGTGDMSSDKTAAWSISVLHNTIDSAKEYIITNPSSSVAGLNDGVITRIPQLNIDVDYQIFFRSGELGFDAISGYLDDPGSDPNLYLALREDFLVLEILEGNTTFGKENFEIEVFFESEGTGSAVGTTVLQQMSFQKENSNTISAPRPLGNTQTNIGDVEYYFNLYLDEELPFNIMDAIHMTPADIAGAGGRQAFSRDLYDSGLIADEEPC
jgi:hypothetical protein|tara:strand:+ start:6824 stop:7825 length:1002 start_codon:yes stop_codon:yes gene_type:complete